VTLFHVYLIGMVWQLGVKAAQLDAIRNRRLVIHQPGMFIATLLVEFLFWPVDFLAWLTNRNILSDEMRQVGEGLLDRVASEPIKPIEPIEPIEYSLDELNVLSDSIFKEAESNGAKSLWVTFAGGQRVQLNTKKIARLEFTEDE